MTDPTQNFSFARAQGKLRDTMRGKIDIPPTTKEFMDLYVKDYYPELKKNIARGYDWPVGLPHTALSPSHYWLPDPPFLHYRP
ncbi:hypothetical protein L227DRAFT_613492 [Lentinus tigrinus ALCF2SS1-6]|uniref:Uncharacterized protein n=1 Tax=Lentinus tigrinus ALCF2SS1-6 TaxID=1328759 RepID=A0A5C2S900_9APHY|nr:hypothetical protein L227DRAFT_613492 [Lentinus tigrinus ALCF2SS1-6]